MINLLVFTLKIVIPIFP